MSESINTNSQPQANVAILGINVTRRQLIITGGLLVLILAALPYLGVEAYYLQLLITTILFINLAGGFNIIAGFTGQLSLGHAIFFGVGGYTAILVWQAGYTLWLSLFVAGIAGSIIAVPIGLILLRLRGLYFAFGTLALSRAIELFLTTSDAVGGASGLNLTSTMVVSTSEFYWISLAVLVGLAVVTYVLKHSIFGLRLQAIRDDETKAKAQGINTWIYKNMAFFLSAIFPAIAGGIYGLFFKHLSPSIFGASQNINMQLMAVLGGFGTLLGPIVGGGLFYTLFQYTGVFVPDAQLLITGVLLIVIILYFPEGIVGRLFSRTWSGMETQKEERISESHGDK